MSHPKLLGGQWRTAVDAHGQTLQVKRHDSASAAQPSMNVWIPEQQANGHPLGPHQMLVGHEACLGHDGGGHTTWTCRVCDETVYGPLLNAHCATLDGPARVR
jgi:hypothetical protein